MIDIDRWQRMGSQRQRELRMLVYRVLCGVGRAREKVFGIGLSRTGTKSLHLALSQLGYRSDHFSTHLLQYEDGALSLDMKGVKVYDALTDITASAFFRELDAAFPGSRFILTTRDCDSWLASCQRHFPPLSANSWPHGNRRIVALRQHMYDATCFDAVRFRLAYHRHVEAVQRHFEGKPRDLLVFPVVGGAHWGTLCTFLGKQEPKVAFPWANRRSGR